MGAYENEGSFSCLDQVASWMNWRKVLSLIPLAIFAQALSAAASKMKHVNATIVMPDNSPESEVEAGEGLWCGSVFSGSRPMTGKIKCQRDSSLVR
jgi:hypothetical protein